MKFDLSDDQLQKLGSLVHLGMQAAASQVAQQGLKTPNGVVDLIAAAPALAQKIDGALAKPKKAPKASS